jgi:predicted nucleotidyltransferase
MRQVQDVVRAIRQTIGSKVLGIYLHGSATDGGLKPASDLDVLVVAARSLSGSERRALVDALIPLSGASTRDRRSVELTVVVQSRVRPWQYPPEADFLFGDWLREEIEADGPPSPGPMTNLAVEIPQLLTVGHTLSGPDPRTLLDEVPVADSIRGSLDAIPSLLEDLHRDTRNVLLTLARVWATVATGRVVSKDAAASWALTRLSTEHQPPLRHAHDLYLTATYAEENIWPEDLQAGVEPHVNAVLEEIERAAARLI